MQHKRKIFTSFAAQSPQHLSRQQCWWNWSRNSQITKKSSQKLSGWNSSKRTIFTDTANKFPRFIYTAGKLYHSSRWYSGWITTRHRCQNIFNGIIQGKINFYKYFQNHKKSDLYHKPFQWNIRAWIEIAEETKQNI